MKRYTADELHGNLYYMLPDDAEFYSRDELIAAGVLVPVPDGEAVTISQTRKRRKFIYNGKLYMKQAGMYVNDEGDCIRIDRAEIVQPVRLVKLEDVG